MITLPNGKLDFSDEFPEYDRAEREGSFSEHIEVPGSDVGEVLRKLIDTHFPNHVYLGDARELKLIPVIHEGLDYFPFALANDGCVFACCTKKWIGSGMWGPSRWTVKMVYSTCDAESYYAHDSCTKSALLQQWAHVVVRKDSEFYELNKHLIQEPREKETLTHAFEFL